MQLAITKNDLKRNISEAWYQLSFLHERKKLMLYQDSIYLIFLHAATIRYETEATSYLEMASAETKVMEVQNSLSQLDSDIMIREQQLRVLLNDTTSISFIPANLGEKDIIAIQDSVLLINNPLLAYIKQQVDIANAQKKVQKAKMLPDLSIGYFNQSLIGSPTQNGEIAVGSNRFSGVHAGITIPLFYGSYKANIKTTELRKDIAQTNANYYNTVLVGQYEQQLQEVLKYSGSLRYYRDKAVPQANLIIGNAQKSFSNGAIDYVEYFLNLSQGLELKFQYLNTLNGYNQAVINLEYLIGQ